MSDELSVIFGWGAPPMAEQFPSLPSMYADKFDALNKAIIMCHLHGLISDSVRNSAIRKCTKQITTVLAQHGAAPLPRSRHERPLRLDRGRPRRVAIPTPGTETDHD